MAKIDEFFRFMKEQNASDLHVTTGETPCLRLHGEIVKLNHPALTSQDAQNLIFEILTDKQKKQFIEQWELDCSYSVEGCGRFRVNVFMQRKGLGAVFRIIPTKIPSLTELGMPSSLLEIINVHKGLILVTGPTGSGKSTTLAALIDHINNTESTHILTVEDPIEFVHDNKKSIVNQREVGGHTKTFSNALKAALREDPDVILVGEMRDLETISLAMTAAETGHLVFGTLHTNSAPKTIDRIIDVFPQEQQPQIRVMLSESLRGVIAQTLFPRQDKKGRIAAIEVMLNTTAVANLIREGKTFQIPSAMQTGKGQGMITFEMYIEELIAKGQVSAKDGYAYLGKPIKPGVAPAAAGGSATAAKSGTQPGVPTPIKKPA
jgi:twitching motility protein PilT